MSKRELKRLAEKAREQRLEGIARKSISGYPLRRFAFENSYVLFHILRDHNYSPVFMAGLSTLFPEMLGVEFNLQTINSVDDFDGPPHYWIECDEYVIDISPEIEGHFGEVYVEEELPETYHRFEDSDKKGREALRSGFHEDLCTYCAGRRTCSCETQETGTENGTETERQEDEGAEDNSSTRASEDTSDDMSTEEIQEKLEELVDE